MVFRLLLEKKKFEASSPCSFGDINQNIPGLPVLKFYSKCNETLPHMLHAKVHILTVYYKSVAPPRKSISSMAAKTLEREQQSPFDGRF